MVKLSRLKNQKGQLLVEMVLLLALSVGIISLVSAAFRQNQYMAMFVSKPWTSIRSMIQKGNWNDNKPHPSSAVRIATVEGEDVQ